MEMTVIIRLDKNKTNNFGSNSKELKNLVL